MKTYIFILALSVGIFLPATATLAHTSHSDTDSNFHGLTLDFVSSTYFIGIILICLIVATTLVQSYINKKRV